MFSIESNGRTVGDKIIGVTLVVTEKFNFYVGEVRE